MNLFDLPRLNIFQSLSKARRTAASLGGFALPDPLRFIISKSENHCSLLYICAQFFETSVRPVTKEPRAIRTIPG